MKRKTPLPRRLPRTVLRKGRNGIHLSTRREHSLLNPDPLELLAEKLGLEETELKNIYTNSRGQKFLRTNYGFINQNR